MTVNKPSTSLTNPPEERKHDTSADTMIAPIPNSEAARESTPASVRINQVISGVRSSGVIPMHRYGKQGPVISEKVEPVQLYQLRASKQSTKKVPREYDEAKESVTARRYAMGIFGSLFLGMGISGTVLYKHFTNPDAFPRPSASSAPSASSIASATASSTAEALNPPIVEDVQNDETNADDEDNPDVSTPLTMENEKDLLAYLKRKKISVTEETFKVNAERNYYLQAMVAEPIMKGKKLIRVNWKPIKAQTSRHAQPSAFLKTFNEDVLIATFSINAENSKRVDYEKTGARAFIIARDETDERIQYHLIPSCHKNNEPALGSIVMKSQRSSDRRPEFLTLYPILLDACKQDENGNPIPEVKKPLPSKSKNYKKHK